MAVQILDSNLDLGSQFSEEILEGLESTETPLDPRRRLEQKIEEMRLIKETQEFDFDMYL